MSLSGYEQVASEADSLPREEQLQLIAHLAERLSSSKTDQAQSDRPRWEESAGILSRSICGEDAQSWVTRTRRESDQHRGTK
jgi:hypothetical protein